MLECASWLKGAPVRKLHPLILSESVLKDVRGQRGANHVLAYALRTTKLINNRRSHCEEELIFVIKEISDFEIITLYAKKLVKGSERGQKIGKLLG